MKFEVDEKMVEPIIRDQIAAAVVSQLGNTDELVSRMVQLALSKKVDDSGKVNQYSSYNKFDFVEALAGKAIRDAATEAIREIVAKEKPVIQAAIEAELKRRPKKTAAAILSAFLEGVSNNYRIKADFTITNPE